MPQVHEQIYFANKEPIFTINKNQQWAILGPSGSGKTTLLKSIAKRCYIQSEKSSSAKEFASQKQEIIFVDVKHNFKNLQHNHNFFYQQRYSSVYAEESQTVQDYLTETQNNSLRNQPWTINSIIELFSLTQLLNKRLIQLSNGETKRIRIAVALLSNPQILLIDNPLIGLDITSRQYFENIFKAIVKSGIYLVITALADELPGIITNVIVLDNNGGFISLSKSEFLKERTKLFTQEEHRLNKEQIARMLYKKHEKRFEYLVKMKNINVIYGNIKILQNINWKIKHGERWALSGPNGSGKTTLLNLISGDHPQAYANDIELFDRKRGSGESIWEIKEKIGFVSPELFQYFPGKYNCLQVVESGFYDTIGVFQKVPENQRVIAKEWMKALGISKNENISLGQTSATQQRLTLLARALVKKPYLLILDEPCQGFEHQQQMHFRNIIEALAEITDMAIIYVTHHEEQLPKCIIKRFVLNK